MLQNNCQIMLRLFDKENLSPPHPDAKEIGKSKPKPTRPNEALQSPQKDLSGPVTAEHINLQVFEKQLKKLAEACENQRRENRHATQIKNKLQNQVKVLQVEKQSLISENTKLRFEITDLFSKMKDMQKKSSNQLTEFYSVKNQNASLQVQLKRYQDSQKEWSQKWSQLAKINAQLEVELSRAKGEESFWKSECKVRSTQIELLRGSLSQLQIENKRLAQNSQSNAWVSEQKFNQIGKQLQNWKNAFDKKEQELETRAIVLQEENNLMRKTIQQFSNHTLVKHTPLQRSCSLPSENTDKFNEYQVRLFVKQSQIQKLAQNLRRCEQKLEILQLENALLSKKCTQGTVFSPAGYQRYNQIQNQILKKSDLRREARQLRTEVETKERQIQCLIEKLNSAKQEVESATIESRKLEAEIDYEKIMRQNIASEFNSTKTKLGKEIEALKQKIAILKKECIEKDKIIMDYIGKNKN